LKLCEEDPARAAEVLELLQMNEGNSSGLGIGCISWDGEVYADQFWRNKPLGNIRQKTFSEIWTDEENELLIKLKQKKKYVKGVASSAAGWMFAAAISGRGPKPQMIFGGRIRPAT